MCGIAGVFAEKIDQQHKNTVTAILQNQHARGPDHEAQEKISGTHCELLLGHNRLSIIDVSAVSHQPMWDATKRWCISYNGEIYNYIELRAALLKSNVRFETQSDTEVLLNAFAQWGTSALSLLNGPFAFAVFDRETETLWLCRDRFGVRPLYYVVQNGALYFASSVSVLAKTLGNEPDLTYAAGGLNALVYENGGSGSPFQGIQSLPAAHMLCVRLRASGDLSLTCGAYYNFSERVETLIETLPVDDTGGLIQLISDRFQQAVKLRLRSDVPLGITLSSGLDSSSVAAIVSSLHPDTVGFSFGHPNHRRSEGPLTQKCADYLGIKMEYVTPGSKALIAALFKTIEVQEAPFSGFSVVAQYLLYQQIRRFGIKVILGGQGGDEGFMGYRKFIAFWIKNLFREKKYAVTVRNFLQFMPLFLSELSSISAYWKYRHRYFSAKMPAGVLRLPVSSPLNVSLGKNESLWHRQAGDITQFSLPTLLRYEDRNAMGNSVESRLPFMDYELLELGVALPASLKLRGGFGKWPIRQMMKGRIPDQIRLAHYKRGFDISMQNLLREGLGKTVRDALQENPAVLSEFLNTDQTVATAFSDAALIRRPKAVSEAITLLWLGRFFN